MNSEELELSLRSEFESYLKGVLAEMRQEAAEFQNRIEADFDKQKAMFDEAFRGFAARFDSERSFDAAFSGTVAEHLRLARDEGARITADAMVEAEKLGQPEVPVEVKYDAIRDAVNDISSKDTQSAILKSLVQHAAEFAPRGAFFIIKNEHFAGWKVFGGDEAAENAIREIHFPTSTDSILRSAVTAKSTVDNSAAANAGDSAFLEPLHFGEPDRRCAIPLVARGRSVAVLYIDHGSDDANLNREALETMVRVAGLTIELLASMQAAKTENRTLAAADFEDTRYLEDAPQPAVAETLYATDAIHYPVEEVRQSVEPRFDETIREMPVAAVNEFVEEEPAGFAFRDSASFEGGFPRREVEPATGFDTNPFEAEVPREQSFDAVPELETAPQMADNPYAETPYQESTFEVRGEQSFEPVETYETNVETSEPVRAEARDDEPKGTMAFDTGGSIETAPVVSSPFDTASSQYEPAAVVSNSGLGKAIEPVMDAAIASVPQARLSDRPVDLPIEVPEEDRRIHNDARRFARLLVSEIKLYNEKKVIEGRQSHDLYTRLREAIDRSREMYDKRVQPPVAAKFDYFHYEIVNSLADGDVLRLGSGYPGSSV